MDLGITQSAGLSPWRRQPRTELCRNPFSFCLKTHYRNAISLHEEVESGKTKSWLAALEDESTLQYCANLLGKTCLGNLGNARRRKGIRNLTTARLYGDI